MASVVSRTPILLNSHLQALSYNGGHFAPSGNPNPEYCVTNCLNTSTKIHRSRRSNCDLVLSLRSRAAEDAGMTLTHVALRAPTQSVVPLRGALLWVSEEEPDPESYTAKFTTLPSEELANVEVAVRPHPHQPVLGLYLPPEPESGRETYHEFAVPPWCRYIHVKFLNAHHPADAPEGLLSPLEVECLALVGFLGGIPTGARRPYFSPTQLLGQPVALPPQWNALRVRKQPVNFVHTDLDDILRQGPCLVVLSGYRMQENDDRLRTCLEKVAQVEANKGSTLRFFLVPTSWHQWARPEDKQLLAELQFDFKLETTPPLVAIVNRPTGLAYVLNSNGELNEQTFQSFVDQFDAGSLERYLGSNAPPKLGHHVDFPATTVAEGSTLEGILHREGRDVLVYVYSLQEEYTGVVHQKYEQGHIDGWGPVGPPPGVHSVIYSVHKLAARLASERRVTLCLLNSYYNWAPKELLGYPQGVLAVYPFGRKAEPFLKPVRSVRRPVAPSEVLRLVLEQSSGRLDHLQPVLAGLEKEEAARAFHRGAPTDEYSSEALEPRLAATAMAASPLQHEDPCEDQTALLGLSVTRRAPGMELARQANHRPSPLEFTYEMLVVQEVRVAPEPPPPPTMDAIDCVARSLSSGYLAVGGGPRVLNIFRLSGDPLLDTPTNRPASFLNPDIDPSLMVTHVCWGPEPWPLLASVTVTRGATGGSKVTVWRWDHETWLWTALMEYFCKPTQLVTAAQFAPEPLPAAEATASPVHRLALALSDGVLQLKYLSPALLASAATPPSQAQPTGCVPQGGVPP
eukprot:RCo023364